MGFKSTLTTMLLCLAGIGTLNAQAPKEQKVLDWAKDLAERVQIDGYAQAGFTYQHTGGLDDNDQLNKRESFIIFHSAFTSLFCILLPVFISYKICIINV